jgi:3-methyladenine DNA glycosylase AlkD
MSIKSELVTLSNKDKVAVFGRFFKTGVGQYGEGDKFLGVMVPQIRSAVNKYWKTTTDKDIDDLVKSEYHELRLAGLLIIVKKFEKGDPKEQKKIFEYYLSHLKYINNWDLVDLTAPNIVGNYLFAKDKSILYKLARSTNLWERRVSILSTFTFIRNQQFEDTLAISEILLHDKHDLIHKAVGWMLREMGKRDLSKLVSFLDKFASVMPRTMLRYAIEKLTKEQKTHYMKI